MTNTTAVRSLPVQMLDPADFPESQTYLGIRLTHGDEVRRYTASDDFDRAIRYATRCLSYGWERAEVCHPITGVVLHTVFPPDAR